jgi:hypothetical protein
LSNHGYLVIPLAYSACSWDEHKPMSSHSLQRSSRC